MAKARSAAQKAATKKMLAARAAKLGKKNNRAKELRKELTKARKGKGNKGRKLTSAQKSAMKAGAAKYWAKRRANSKSNPMPLKVLKQHRARLDQVIKQRSK